MPSKNGLNRTCGPSATSFAERRASTPSERQKTRSDEPVRHKNAGTLSDMALTGANKSVLRLHLCLRRRGALRGEEATDFVDGF